MASFSSSSFSVDAFSELSFDFGSSPVIESVIGDSYERPYERYLREEAAKERKKQNAILKLKLEAQEALVVRKDLLKLEQDKQTTRQLMALERREREINKELLLLMQELRELQKQSKLRQEREALLVLSLAYPFMDMQLN